MALDRIVIRGAREHNLKNIDLEIPRDRLVVITGVSGSGKSSLAFDTIYAEGQRRYVESLSAYARQFLEQMEKPDVDSIEGLSPAISIEQKSVSKNPRSTVATVTEVYDYLRLLFASVGRVHCLSCGKEISQQTVTQIVDAVLSAGTGEKVEILAPVVRGRKGEYRKELARLARDGYSRVIVDGEERALEDEIVLDRKRKHDIDVVIDRVRVSESSRGRLADSVALALSLSDGLVRVTRGKGKGELFSEKFACPDCNVSYPEITPRLFSFNSPHGACPECDGLGSTIYFDPELIVPDKNKSIREGAIAPWIRRTTVFHHQMLETLSRHFRFSLLEPFGKLPERVREVLLHGSGEEGVRFHLEEGERRYFFTKPFEGVIGNLERRYRETDSEGVREELSRYMNNRPCRGCGGARLKKEALSVTVGGRGIDAVTRFSIQEALTFFGGLSLSGREEEIAARILKEIRSRLSFLADVGLDYLTLDRTSSTLSGGEGQRIRLATQIGSSLMGVLYILDEPSIGLHQRDNRRLLSTLRQLRDQGNTVLVVEHDEETIRSADHVIDMGPGAGEDGGRLVAAGPPEAILRCESSLTGQYLSGVKEIPCPTARRRPNGNFLSLSGCRANNLKGIDVSFPLGLITCVTGVSGSGKSTLVLDTLYRALAQRIFGSRERPGAHDRIDGLALVDKVIHIDQSPIGRTPRSNPATYSGAFTPIRDLFAMLPESKARGYRPGRYSFNVKGGRCEACEGDGILKIEMHFMPDVYVTCEICRGKRYNRETLEIAYKGKTIADVLAMTVDQALPFFEAIPAIRQKLSTLSRVGLGYIRLGQPATTLSGGEAQRVKLARELSKRATGKTVYILDEPTTGLHFDDIRKLLAVLQMFADSGNTVIVIEHNLDVVKTADYIVDLGPEGGDRGGEVVACGTPEEVAEDPRSFTGQFLRRVLGGGAKRRALG
ncbi:MAG: excinuclease ABC subunit A [Deltaproteobacteria bacterium GWC2_65_14]|nr:MAG: excinuclease ABC subunit A [Deltaproteobacteria bacterium GWC2_65_14]